MSRRGRRSSPRAASPSEPTLEELEERGVDAVLIGEALMRADDPEAKVRELTADEQATREHLL